MMMLPSKYFSIIIIASSFIIIRRTAIGIKLKSETLLISAPGQGKDKRSTLPILGRFMDTSAMECAIRCNMNSGCGGINMFSGSGHLDGCELVNGKIPISVVKAVGYKYYENLSYNPCSSNPCQNGASCSIEITEYLCHCIAGYTGVHCETDIDECQQSGCLHGSTCIDGINNFTCQCSPGYKGQLCESCLVMKTGPNCDQDCKLTVQGNEYNGTVSKTTNGLTCQRWDSFTPHFHIYALNSYFPDATVSNAANYCRNPLLNGETGPWCYTTDSSVRWEFCDIQLCP